MSASGGRLTASRHSAAHRPVGHCHARLRPLARRRRRGCGSRHQRRASADRDHGGRDPSVRRCRAGPRPACRSGFDAAPQPSGPTTDDPRRSGAGRPRASASGGRRICWIRTWPCWRDRACRAAASPWPNPRRGFCGPGSSPWALARPCRHAGGRHGWRYRCGRRSCRGGGRHGDRRRGGGGRSLHLSENIARYCGCGTAFCPRRLWVKPRVAFRVPSAMEDARACSDAENRTR